LTAIVNTFSTVGYGSFVIPAGITTINVCAFGAGAGGANYTSGYGIGGGGGACAKTINLTVTPLSTIYFYVGQGGAQAANGANSWINIQANAAPTSVANGALAIGGKGGNSNANNAGGNTSSSIGTNTYAGGNGYCNGGYVSGGGGGAGSGGAGANSQAATAETVATYVGGAGGIGDGTFSAGGLGGNGIIGTTGSVVGLVGTFPGGGGGGAGNTGGNDGTGAVGANGQIQIAYGVTTLNYTPAQANATTGVQALSSYIINTTLPQVNVSASVGVVTANSFNAVTTPQALATTGFGIVTPIIPLNNPTAPRASVFASAGVVTTGTFIPSYPTQALATTGVGSLTPKASIQNIPISGVVATTSSIPLGGDILIIGFDIQMTIDGGMSITLGSGVNMVIGGL
jgi:hypothetical protein